MMILLVYWLALFQQCWGSLFFFFFFRYHASDCLNTGLLIYFTAKLLIYHHSFCHVLSSCILAAMLATQLNDLVTSKEIEVKTVVQLDKYICNIIQETR